MALDAILRISEVEELAKKSAQEAAVQAKDLIRQAEADGQALMAQTRAVSASKAKDWMAEAEQAAAEQAREIDRQALSTVAGKIGTITWRECNVG